MRSWQRTADADTAATDCRGVRRDAFGTLLLVLVFCGVAHADSLQQALSPEQFQRAGLHKLTAAELAFLNSRLYPESQAAPAPAAAPVPVRADSPVAVEPPAAVGKSSEVAMPPRPLPASAPPVAQPAPSAGAAQPPAAADTFGLERKVEAEAAKRSDETRTITSRIAGEFRGWRGHTTFTLENGQVWRQCEAAEFIVRVSDPEVTIEKGRFGVYFLRITGYGSRVKVERVN